MRGVLYHFEDFARLARELESGDEERELALPTTAEFREGEWVLATITVDDESACLAACTIDRGSGLRLTFADRDWERLYEFAHRGGPASVPPEQLAPVSHLKPPNANVLIVDDDDDLKLVVSSVLRAAGFAVRAVSSAEEALDHLRSHPVDLLVLDWHLPGMSGLDLCRALRKSEQGVPVLFLSAHSTAEEMTLAFEAGADDFVGKPFRAPELGARILGLLQRVQSPGSGRARA